MIVLFINAHRHTQQGKVRFQNYYNQVHKILKNSIFYGNQIQCITKTHNQLSQYIYDQTTYQCNPKSKQMFASLQYIFIDGDISTLPWTNGFQQLLLFVKTALKQDKKVHCNGFAHFAAYYYLTVLFDKPYYIANRDKITPEIQKKVDYQYDQQTGDLAFRGKKVSNSGLKVVKQTRRPFSAKSRQAVTNGVVLSTKYHYVVFNSKNGQKILKNINFPFTFYWKGSIVCTSKSISKAKANILVQTQLGNPIAFTYKSSLSTQGLSCQMLLLIQNWLNQSIGKLQQTQSKLSFDMFQTISLDNQLNMKKHFLQSHQHTQAKNLTRIKSSLLTSKQSTLAIKSKYYDKIYPNKALEMIRSGGKYQTQEEQYGRKERENKIKNLGRSRMCFKGGLQQTEIKNYVNLIPSRPVTAHKFRDTDKHKWIDQRNFFLS